MTGNEKPETTVSAAFAEIKITEARGDFPKVEVCAEFVIAHNGARARIKRIDKDTVFRVLACAIADFTDFVEDDAGGAS